MSCRYGSFPPHSLYSVDQVTLPLVIVIGVAWDKNVIRVPVCVSHPVAGSDKHFCSIQLCSHQCAMQPNILFVFQVTWKKIIDVDKQA